MQVSEKCVEMLKSSNISMLKSNVLIADLKTIQYGIIDETNEPNLDYDNYWHKPLSNDILELVNEWKNKEFSEDLFLMLNEDLKQIVENDNTKYSAQMIFPLFVHNKLDGLAIFFRTTGDYILSSSKAPKTIRDFIQKELNTENEKSTEEFDLNWFNKDNIDMVDDKVEEHLNKLLDIEEYIELNRKLSRLTVELTANLDLTQSQKFREYQQVELELSSYQNSLAYYIALNKK